MKKKFKFPLAYQILVGLILGIVVGAIFYGNPAIDTYLKPLGTIFLNMIKMIVVPIIVSTLVIGVAGTGDLKQLGKLGGKTLIYFEIVTTIAILVGLLSANIFQPGAGIDMSELTKTDIGSYVETTEQVSGQGHGILDIVVGIVPTNVISAMANGNMLAIIFFSVVFGLGVAAIGEKGKPVLAFFEGVADAMFWVTNFVMKFAPFGVFGLIGVTVSKFGLASLVPLGKLMILVYVTMAFFILVVLGGIAKIVGINIFHVFTVLKEELILAYSTSSSETVLPKIIEKMEKFGCPKDIVSFVVPTGYSFNLDGSTLYQALAAIFIAQMYGINLSISEQITLILVLMVTSKGIAGVPGVSFVVLLATLGTVGIPLEGLAFIAGVDRLLDMARTVVNVCGNSLAAIVMSKWEGRFDNTKKEQYYASIKNAA
ncbi:cation:dicarboxylase symporter family transporter [Schinkia azotoformans]|uniref:Proton/sodium-glutamate symport protein n=1 Tax=Schinkia azotoformans LMG 9581 TaxID=1131731 RepID=K6DII1_SCHAZ|nr:cation:dicarboxylase symporter family transporter [Schinkia azotoformans]EKN67933.1 proton/sodium-glutamate symport protein [Schinkia azotoformans LMG 9581]MEC1637047.1 cation:dicarboxylase symporter family transporter [Schinkia azotoformans]MEC1722133.1 cation:dicarboxylase symporter family transporter [Schinkia azotoformans]MEC1945508.1 cation:dicarboxylase symporter family transporter [Schinkia azotoformans]MED4351352.1 cation:dicarboxylase symporter family transporter [Schinkia azotofor